MAIRFEPLKLKNPDLFGVKLIGTVSPADKRRICELADKCMSNGKVDLILDLSGLDSIGGGGAQTLADLQTRLVAAGGEAIVVGAGEVVQHFLDQKFLDLPLRFYLSVKDAEQAFHSAVYERTEQVNARDDAPVVDQSEKSRERVPAAKPAVAPASDMVLETVASIPDADLTASVSAGNQDSGDVGAMGFFEEENADSGLDVLLDEFSGLPVRTGRRKDHHYTSLAEAIQALGAWSEAEGLKEFGDALGNLLFSHGLAEVVTLLAVQEDRLVTADGSRNLPVSGSLVSQFADVARPLTLLDIREDELTADETSFLEELAPDMILPVLQDDELSAVILLVRGGDEREYSLAENFAFELLIRVVTGAATEEADEGCIATPMGEDPGSMADTLLSAEPVPPTQAQLEAARESRNNLTATEAGAATETAIETEAGQAESEAQQTAFTSPDHAPAGVLLNLALELPEADDSPHFWRLFARYAGEILGLRQLAVLAPERNRPTVMTGDDDSWFRLELGNERLQLFFQTIERPVEVCNLPDFFKDTREDLERVGVNWMINLSWEQRYLGTVIADLDPTRNLEGGQQLDGDGLTGIVEEVFRHTSRLLARFDGTNDNADLSLELVRIILSQREKRCFGSDHLTRAIVEQVDLLAREMSFPPDQKRDLTYGCLLRDIGLIDQPDELLTAPAERTPEQIQAYRNHVNVGAALIDGLELPATIVEVIKCHHERFNGEGFPAKLAGRDIPLAARVVTVVENYVSMITGAAGGKTLSPAEAADILQQDQGQRYDPDIVSLFLGAVRKQADATSSEIENDETKVRHSQLT